MKKIIALLLAAALLLSLCACGGTKPKDFTYKEMTITLNGRFKEAEFDGYDVTYDSGNAAVFVLREDKSLLGGTQLTLAEYAVLVYNANVNRSPQAVKVENDIWSFEYEWKSDTDSVVYHYYTTMFESEQAFWIVQFAAKQDSWAKLQSEIRTYAQSVKFR